MNGSEETFVVVEIGAEGGSIKVLGCTADDGAAQYSVQLRDQTVTCREAYILISTKPYRDSGSSVG